VFSECEQVELLIRNYFCQNSNEHLLKLMINFNIENSRVLELREVYYGPRHTRR
jgi:hypothetical protein